jgi:hypothetical protein
LEKENNIAAQTLVSYYFIKPRYQSNIEAKQKKLDLCASILLSDI